MYFHLKTKLKNIEIPQCLHFIILSIKYFIEIRSVQFFFGQINHEKP